MRNKLKLWTLFALFLLAGVRIVFVAAYSMVAESDYWEVVRDKFTRDSICIPAQRGNILSSDGKTMVASVPEFRILMDFVVIDKDSAIRVKAQAWRDSALRRDIDSIATGLAVIFPDRSAEWFKERIERGRKRGSHAWRVYPGLATYKQYQECKQLPLFRERQYKGGFFVEKSMQRKKLYGSLAARTLGDVYRDSDAARSGLEWCYDTLLRGRDGYAHQTKVRNKLLQFVDVEPVNGHDLVSTIDVRMQDIVEKALLDQLTTNDNLSLTAEKGVAILMDVPTGDVKAIISLTKTEYGWQEIQNDAINALWEPGSTFKTGSIMVAMEDGYVTPSTVVYCEKGVYNMHGRLMKDHNWRNPNSYEDLTITQVLEKSSNVGVSKTIDKYYHDQPEKFVQGLYNLGVGIKYGLPMGSDPWVRMPVTKGEHQNWSPTALAWMSIGYEVQVTPLNTLTFYNAIANNGKMVRPRFVTQELEKGKVVREFPVEVIKEKICSQQTLDNIHDILEKVVSEGLGGKAGNKKFHVSGKTGTAQVAENGSYAAHKYMVTFCGYFPSEEPKYSCIVCIYKRGTPASGGSQCGPVFSRISQLVMNQGQGKPINSVADSTSLFLPQVIDGNMNETRQLLSIMNIPWQEQGGNAWGSVSIDTASHELCISGRDVNENSVPDVMGMGAKDAVYALQKAGLRVNIVGTGRVIRQSIPAGTTGASGKTVAINLK